MALRIECGAERIELGTDLVLPQGDARLEKREAWMLTQLTIDSELKRTRGIRLFNKNIAL